MRQVISEIEEELTKLFVNSVRYVLPFESPEKLAEFKGAYAVINFEESIFFIFLY